MIRDMIMTTGFFIICFVNSPSAFCQKQENGNSKEIISQLRSDDWIVRDGALGEIRKAKEFLLNAQIRTTLLDLLPREAVKLHDTRKRFRTTGEAGGEEYGEYLINLLQLTLPLTEEQHVPYLLEFVDFNRSVGERITTFGELSLGSVMAKIEDDAPGIRKGVAEILGVWLQKKEGYVLQGIQRDSIVGILGRKALLDPNAFVRIKAIAALAKSDDKKVASILQIIRNEDSYKETRSGKVVYPVREAAAASIKKLEEKE